MRAFGLLLTTLFFAACGQKVDRVGAAPDCDRTTMNCRSTAGPELGSSAPSGSAGAAAAADDVATVSGQVLAFGSDYFDQGSVFAGAADVSAVGEGGARVNTTYDGKSFQLDNVAKQAINWFYVVPAEGSGMLPTIMPLDTRAAQTGPLSVGLARSTDVDTMFLNLGTDRSPDRAQIVLRVVDAQGRALTGVQATLTAEVTAYRMATAWIANATSTDDTGMIFLGNVQAGSALSTTNVILTGAASARVEVAVVAGAITIVTAVVTPK